MASQVSQAAMALTGGALSPLSASTIGFSFIIAITRKSIWERSVAFRGFPARTVTTGRKVIRGAMALMVLRARRVILAHRAETDPMLTRPRQLPNCTIA